MRILEACAGLLAVMIAGLATPVGAKEARCGAARNWDTSISEIG
jgi:hypothetical protein